jgi:Fuc2NAc and GlcNAc transferase
MVSLLAVFAAAGLSSWALTGLVRRWMVARSILDVPNARSSHTVPTARGGGLAIAAVVVAGLLGGAALGWLPIQLALALAGGGAMVAAVGWMDDCRGVTVRLRLLVHAAAAVWALAWLGGFPRLQVSDSSLFMGVGGWVLAVLGIVWAVNFYNFMDGIDGIAGGQAVVVGVGAGALLMGAGAADLAGASFLVAAASFGFLLWNWSPARIFMGDVGSGLLGFLFAALAVASENRGAVPVLVWVLMLGVFVVDATVTLVRRMIEREPLFHAHKKHAYQRAVQAGWSHAGVSGFVLALGVVLTGAGWMALRAPRYLLAVTLAGMGALVLLHAAVLVWSNAVQAAEAPEAAPREAPLPAPSHVPHAPPRRVPEPARAAFRAPSTTAIALKRGRRADGTI